MPSGTVTWVDSRTGYGFISPTGGGKDLFLHPADIISGSKTLVVGATVEFVLGVGIKGGIISTNIVLSPPDAGEPGIIRRNGKSIKRLSVPPSNVVGVKRAPS
jgi:cold shock CspA family protein